MDQVVSIYGFPTKITGNVGTQRQNAPEGFEDSFTAHLRYDSGITATVRASVVSPEREQLRYWVRGTKGSFKKFHLDPQEDRLKEGLRPGMQGYGIEEEGKWGVLTESKDGGFGEQKVKPVENKGYTVFYEEFARALSGQGNVPVDGFVAAGVIKLCELMRESSKEEKTIYVKLD